MALTDQLFEYFALNESASGVRTGLHAGYTLSDYPTNGVAAVTGLVYPYTAEFQSATNPEQLYRNSSAPFQGGNVDFTLIAWIKMATAASAVHIPIVTIADLLGNSDWRLYQNTNNDKLGFEIWTGAGTTGNVQVEANWFGTTTTGVWYMLMGYHDASNDLLGVSVNAGTIDTTATGGSGPYISTASFDIGASDNAVETFDGLIGPVILWRRVLSAAEITQMYNSGAGLTYAAMQPTTPPSTLNVMLGEPTTGSSLVSA